MLISVPNDLVDGGTHLCLLPFIGREYTFEISEPKYYWDNLAQSPCFSLITLLMRVDRSFRISFHCSRLLLGNRVVQPCSGRTETVVLRVGGLLFLEQIPHLPPVLSGFDPAVQSGFPGFVLA